MFLSEKYLIENESGEELYKYVETLPIVDAHNHLDAKEIVENKGWNDIWEVEGASDHYVWELMRRAGVEEKYITGDASNKEKWLALTSVFPKFAGNPTYEWIHLDLLRRFGIKEIISSKTAEFIWEETKKQLAEKKPQQLLKEMNVEILCTTDEPFSNLEYHFKAREKVKNVKILPTWRPDKLINIESKNWIDYVKKLGEEFEENVESFNGFLKAIEKSHKHFENAGCAASDHAILNPNFFYVNEKEAKKIYEKAFSKKELSTDEVNKFKSFLMIKIGELNVNSNWVTQLHIGAVRDYRDHLYRTLGPDSGGDVSTNNLKITDGLKYFLNEFDGKLKIVLYVLDPTHLPTITTIARAFPNVFIGAPWWFNDSPFGMKLHLKYISSVDLLFNMPGMVTDSRKLLSFGSRTEVFRRVLSSVVGEMVEIGQIPFEVAKSLVEHISYTNQKTLFFGGE